MKTRKMLGFAAIIAAIALNALLLAGCPAPDDNGGTTPSDGTTGGGKTLVKIEVTDEPAKTEYDIGDDLELDGLVVTATYDDGTTEVVTINASHISGYDKTRRGNQNITVTYQGQTAIFVVSVFDPNLETVKTPKASPGTGTYHTAQTVTLSTETTETGVKIYYTTDGTTPTKASTEYTSPISISVTTTLKAFAVHEDMNDSEILTAVYTFSFAAAPALTLAADDAKITYTWTASNPVADTYDVYWKAGDNLSADEVKTGTPILGATSGGSITGLTNGTAYSVIVTANKTGYASSDSAVQTATPGNTYIITGSGTSFTAKKGADTIGTANQPIQTVLEAIRGAANGAACTIQFGVDDTTLDIGTADAVFNNTGGTWGAVTLTGKITSAVSNTGSGTIAVRSAVSVTSTADIANTAATNGIAVYLYTDGNVTISGGTVSATTYRTVFVACVLTISGGTVSATTGTAVYSSPNQDATIIVSETAKITSANSSSTSGTICLPNYSLAVLTISGGTVENTAASSGIAVYNASSRSVTISGGTVSATTGRAVNHDIGGWDKVLTISGGTVSATTGTAVYNAQNGTVNISGGTVSTTTGIAVYNFNLSGRINISGGTVSSITGRAVYNGSRGKITVSQADAAIPTLITSANTTAEQGTIFIASSGSETDVRLEITGGTIENTSTTTGNAIYNASSGAVTVSGGTVSATGASGYSIYNNSTGVVTITEPPAVIVGNKYGVN